jgi:anaerobic ribonucleoside-triphosphate reductase activating protein
MAELEDAQAAKAAAKSAALGSLAGADADEEKNIIIADVESESIVDGPGFRFAIYAQGCPHACPGCHNPQTHSFEGGTPVSAKQLLHFAHKSPLQKGITLTGGDPFCQAKALIPFVEMARAGGYNIWAYSGYLYEELLQMEDASKLLDLCDVLVDGPFEEDKKSLELKWKGSANQRCIDLNATREAGEVVLFAD